MKILFACGGTAGHINPAIAAATYIKNNNPNVKILFVGNPNGMEARLVPKAGFDFEPMIIKGIQRKLTLRNIKYNISSIYHLTTSSKKSEKILKKFQPDIVMGTGGHVSGPIVRKAAKMGIKTISHEQNAFPGVTTKILSKYVDILLLAVPKAQEYLKTNCKIKVVGNPVRESIIFAKKEDARKKLNIPKDKICILSFGGSLGAKRINEAISDLMAWHVKEGKIHHIHAMGRYGTELFPNLLKQKGVEYKNNKNLDIREYIDNMDDCLAAADIVISRSGAITLSELQVAGKASILIPSPNVAENHQYHNAMVLAKNDAAIVIEEKDLTGESLCNTVSELINNTDKINKLAQKAASMAIVDTNKRIYDEIVCLLGSN